ncbi:MAG: hypothetical protein IT385_23795 [Deltaproteobacteria bacterium]|nr:hypothetical protein [Deltaproteobacteria bacterium]
MSTAASPFAPDAMPYAGGRFGPVGSLARADVATTLADYKARVAKRYRIAPPDELARFLPEGRLHITPKIDGELWFCVKLGGAVALCAPNGRVLEGIPVAAELERHLAAAPDVVIAGELFVASRSGTRPRVFHVSKALRDPEQAGMIGFKAFDLVRWADEDALQWPWDKRLEHLRRHLPESGRAAVTTVVEGDRREVERRYAEWVDTGKFEGLVVRADNGFTYKVKPAVTIDAVLVAYGERLVADEQNVVRPEVRELVVALVREDGSFQVCGSVGSGLSAEERVGYQARLDAISAPSDFRLVNREGTLCRWVRPEIVIELKVSDLLPPDPGEPATMRMTLAWSPEAGWQSRGPLPLPALLHPVYVRERGDKPIDTANVGLDQLRQIVSLTDDEGDPRAREAPSLRGLPGARVIERKVWVKVTKDKKAVRKYVAWATHKAAQDARYLPYVVCFTDFSPGRKEPLQRDVRVASSEERLREHIARWEADNVKKGWSSA